MEILSEVRGRNVRLTDERLLHICKHIEMTGQEARIKETLLNPDLIVESHHDTSVHVYHKLYDKTPVTRKYLVVAVKFLLNDAFVVASFFTDKHKQGVKLWPH